VILGLDYQKQYQQSTLWNWFQITCAGEIAEHAQLPLPSCPTSALNQMINLHEFWS
jgi:hypothetical protein